MSAVQLAIGNELMGCWRIVEGLDLKKKSDLIAMLAQSITETARSADLCDAKNTVLQFAGFWKDNRTTEDIIADIRTSRTPNIDCEALDD